MFWQRFRCVPGPEPTIRLLGFFFLAADTERAGAWQVRGGQWEWVDRMQSICIASFRIRAKWKRVFDTLGVATVRVLRLLLLALQLPCRWCGWCYCWRSLQLFAVAGRCFKWKILVRFSVFFPTLLYYILPYFLPLLVMLLLVYASMLAQCCWGCCSLLCRMFRFWGFRFNDRNNSTFKQTNTISPWDDYRIKQRLKRINFKPLNASNSYVLVKLQTYKYLKERKVYIQYVCIHTYILELSHGL